jgi:phytoene synthase
MALDARLAGIVRATHEPLLGQMRLAWWRDRLREDSTSWPAGEPVLAALAGWGAQANELVALVDGWEELIGDRPDFAGFAAGRARGWIALAQRLDCECAVPSLLAAGEGWALTDLAAHLSDPGEREAIAATLRRRQWPALRLPRNLRPLAVLYALARNARHGEGLLNRPAAMLTALRVGIAGR